MPDEFPEHEKLQKVKDQSQTIGEFIEFGGYTLCTFREASEEPRWIDKRTGTAETPQGRSVTIFYKHTVENPEWYPEGYYAVGRPIDAILAEYFDIDLNKIEREKRQMLDQIRAMNEKRDAA